jgi:serine/threonine protein kinase
VVAPILWCGVGTGALPLQNHNLLENELTLPKLGSKCRIQTLYWFNLKIRMWKTNQQISGGKYVIEELIGGGGFGVTYRARDNEHKFVVIKTLNHIQQSKPDFPQRQEDFINEAMRLVKCSHPHVVEVHRVIQHDGLWGIVMEHINGKDLGSYLDDHGILSEPEALRIIHQVGEALTFVHDQDILHRDVKPQNILLRRDTQAAVLIDFGLAREFTSGQVRSMTNHRTECFAPIEQYKKPGEPGDYAGNYTDVYALAATLYNLLTNELPTPADLRNKKIPLIEPKTHNPKISDFVNQAILKGMALEPQNRPQSVPEWLSLLKTNKDPIDEVKLVSAVGMDYMHLRKLLAAKQWKEADQETERVMLKVANRGKEGWLDRESIEKFPCEDLRTIDQLWVKASNGHFGFSVQKRIWQEVGGKIDYETEKRLGDRVGWRVDGQWENYGNLKFSLNSPQGHLPKVFFMSVVLVLRSFLLLRRDL